MKRYTFIFITLLFMLGAACIDPYPIPDMSSSQSLVVEGVISSQLKRHQIFLSRSTSLNDERIDREEGADVRLRDRDGNEIELTEEQPGIYETPEFAAQPGGEYTLKIITTDGKKYSSLPVPFKDGPEITDVYGRYSRVDKGVQFYVDTEDSSGNTNFYRWNYIETYEVNAPFPSNWIWLGGNNVVFRDQSIGICYVIDTLRTILVRNTKILDEDKIAAQPLRFIYEKTYLMQHKYSMLVQQFALSEQAYEYWNRLRISSEEQGSLSDQQPGSLPGNLFSESDPGETVLGMFEVCKVSEKRIITNYLDFYDDGFKDTGGFRSGCQQLIPLSVPQDKLGFQMEIHQNDMLIWEVNGFDPMVTFELMPIFCSSCTDLGTTEKPDFF